MYKFITFIRLFVKFATVFLKYILKEIAGKFIYVYIVANYFLLRKNESYLARYIPFFETQIQLNLNAQDSITELVRDNR